MEMTCNVLHTHAGNIQAIMTKKNKKKHKSFFGSLRFPRPCEGIPTQIQEASKKITILIYLFWEFIFCEN